MNCSLFLIDIALDIEVSWKFQFPDSFGNNTFSAHPIRFQIRISRLAKPIFLKKHIRVRWYLIFPKAVGFAQCFIFYLFNGKLKTRVCHRLYNSGKEFTLALFFYLFFWKLIWLSYLRDSHDIISLFCFMPINWFLSLSISPFNQPKVLRMSQ